MLQELRLCFQKFVWRRGSSGLSADIWVRSERLIAPEATAQSPSVYYPANDTSADSCGAGHTSWSGQNEPYTQPVHL